MLLILKVNVTRTLSNKYTHRLKNKLINQKGRSEAQPNTLNLIQFNVFQYLKTNI